MHPPLTITPPIAMLHAVDDSGDQSLANWRISRAAFVQLLNVLQQEGITTTHFGELEGDKTRVKSSPQVILTFDDCARHLLDFAVPELLRRNMTAAFYMPTAYLGGYNAWDADAGAQRMELMTGSDLKELVRLGMEVGSHGHTHTALATMKGAGEIRNEVTHSKQVLEALTGQTVVSFAYPFGSVPRGYQQLLRSSGYSYGLCIYHPFETKLALRRFGVYEKDTPVTLRRKLSKRYRWMRFFYDAIKTY